MRVVVGLGNPEERYSLTRHNVGFMVVDRLVGGQLKREEKMKASVVRVSGILWVKPETYMNRSGEAVRAVADYYKVKTEDIYVVHDDLDIKLGEYKIQRGKGPKDHKGVNSVSRELKSEDYWRVRVGVDNRKGREMGGDEYVLKRFLKEELAEVEKVVEKAAAELIKRLEITR